MEGPEDVRGSRLVWLLPEECTPPHGADFSKYVVLAHMIGGRGWQGPFLVGYPFKGTIQLLTGSHRWMACKLIGRRMPVRILPFEQVQAAWGDPESWKRLLG